MKDDDILATIASTMNHDLKIELEVNAQTALDDICVCPRKRALLAMDLTDVVHAKVETHEVSRPGIIAGELVSFLSHRRKEQRTQEAANQSRHYTPPERTAYRVLGR